MSIVNKILREARLNELFDGNSKFNYTTDFDEQLEASEEDGEGCDSFKTTFEDDFNNLVEVQINTSYDFENDNHDHWDLSFSINGNFVTTGEINSNLSNYLKILNTVASIAKDFISYCQNTFGNIVLCISVPASDKSNKQDQKFNAYMYFTRKFAGIYDVDTLGQQIIITTK